MALAATTTVIPTVHVVDDDPSFRTAVARLLKAAGYDVRTYSCGTEFVHSQVTDGPGCVLLDMFMPDGTGLEVQASLRQELRSLPLIFVSGQGTIPDSVSAMQAGAVDFLTKPVQKQALLGAVAAAIASDHNARFFRDEMHKAELCYQSLTSRQRIVFEGIVMGKLNKQLAADLGIAERTIKAHRAEVMKKMQVDSVAGLVRLAVRLHSRPAPSSHQL